MEFENDSWSWIEDNTTLEDENTTLEEWSIGSESG